MSSLSRRAFLFAAMGALAIGRHVPAFASDRAMTFLAIGDWGFKGERGQRIVADTLSKVAREVKPEFVVSVGDNFYNRGVSSTLDPQWEASFEAIYSDPALGCPWHAVLGNHDYRGNPQAEIDYSRIDPRWDMPARYYRKTKLLAGGVNADFFFLDTTPIVDGRSSAEGPATQLLWLENELASTTADWKIVVGHHPVFSGGDHGDSRALIERVKPLFDRYGVQAYLNGHDHDLQHIAIDGVHYLTCGSGAEARPTGAIDGTQFASGSLGFITAMLTPEALGVFYVGADGSVLHRLSIPVVV